MRALLLSAGFGTRLRPITDRTPKVMVEMGGEPLLGRWLRLLFEGGIERALVNTHYLPEVVENFVASSEWCGRVDLIHEPQLLGTGGTLLANRNWFGSGSLLVTHADNASELDVKAFRAMHVKRAAGVLATMALFESDKPTSCGIAVLDDEGIVREFHEKVANPPGTLANAAAFIFEPEVFDLLAACGKTVIDLSAEVVPRIVGRMQGFKIEGYHRDIGDPESLARARAWFGGAEKTGAPLRGAV